MFAGGGLLPGPERLSPVHPVRRRLQHWPATQHIRGQVPTGTGVRREHQLVQLAGPGSPVQQRPGAPPGREIQARQGQRYPRVPKQTTARAEAET